MRHRARIFALGLMLITAVLLWGCSAGGDTPAASEEAPTENDEGMADRPEEEQPVEEENAPSAEPAPTETPIPIEVDLVITGEEETVFDWTTDRCDDENIPDLPARAWRDAAGQVYLLAPHLDSQPMVGADLNSVVQQCDVIFGSTGDGDPAQWTDAEWLASVYTNDGTNFYGLVHDEYHGWEHNDCEAAPGEHFECWYNAITLVQSTDGGHSWQYALSPPDHLVAAWPTPYEAGTGPYGFYSPSNIIEKDGYYYTIVKGQQQATLTQFVCLMRTPDLSEPSAWRFWDGDAFEGTFVDPYHDEIDRALAHTCSPLARQEIGAQMIESLTYNTEIERYILIGISADQIDGREVWGWYFSLSTDLVTWTHRELIAEMELPWTYQPGDGPAYYLYPSLIDPDSESLTFATTDNQAYLYYTRFAAGGFHLDRDLVRVPVEFVVGQ